MRTMGWLGALTLAVACSKSEDVASRTVGLDAGSHDSGLGTFTFVDASPSDHDAALPLRSDVDVTPYLSALPKAGKSIGHTSVVFKLDLSNGLVAAFKPESKRGHTRYRGEIAAYRLARALGLPNVPPAVPRVFQAAAFRAALAENEKAAALYDAEVVIHAGVVRGALIPWIPHLEFLPIETDVWRARYLKWLSSAEEMPGGDSDLAAQISTLAAFDAVTGNWDRFSGANVGFDKATRTLLFIDNDGAFFEPVPAAPLANQIALLQRIDRFSRRFVTQLRLLDPVSLADALGDEGNGAAILSPKMIASADERRRKVLAIIDAKIATLGEAKVLVFE